jgi:F-type H+-transporting ATPase subunit gamma
LALGLGVLKSQVFFYTAIGPEKETKYVILGEKAKAQLIRDSKKNIAICMTELQRNPLNYTQVSWSSFLN